MDADLVHWYTCNTLLFLAPIVFCILHFGRQKAEYGRYSPANGGKDNCCQNIIRTWRSWMRWCFSLFVFFLFVLFVLSLLCFSSFDPVLFSNHTAGRLDWFFHATSLLSVVVVFQQDYSTTTKSNNNAHLVVLGLFVLHYLWRSIGFAIMVSFKFLFFLVGKMHRFFCSYQISSLSPSSPKPLFSPVSLSPKPLSLSLPVHHTGKKSKANDNSSCFVNLVILFVEWMASSTFTSSSWFIDWNEFEIFLWRVHIFDWMVY